MIDIRKLKELVKLMVENDLTELDLKDQDETVSLRRGAADSIVNHQPVIYQGQPGPAPAVAAAAPAPAPVAAEAPAGAPAAAAAPVDEGLVAIESPMVGTFYSAADPDAEPFISPGASIAADTTVCLVEAMKVFNEIKAEVSGVVERIMVKNGDAVEFGQPLFMVRPA
ncbi:MAG: acetyl-CoA carboxylase biotin carboxyl carrier protein [Planctomycetota bacterium]